jgi:predicted CXXCH cytochrome family protein
MADGDGHGPGGDFYWVTKTYTWTAHGRGRSSQGDSHGHNVLSDEYGIVKDLKLAEAPGGAAPVFDSDYLTCTSCHDPHGNANFRILYDSGTDGPIYTAGSRYDFDYPAPVAFGNSRSTKVGDGGEETDDNHTVYKSGMSGWCANCHENMHDGTTTNIVHRTGFGMSAAFAGATGSYNKYVDSDDLTGGSQATAFWGLVPFEDVNADTVGGYDMNRGPDVGDQVMCLTCHRAHASPFADIARWDMNETFIADSHPAVGDGGLGTNDLTNKYYQYTFTSANQRSLCNKCHGKDAYDAPYGH